MLYGILSSESSSIGRASQNVTTTSSTSSVESCPYTILSPDNSSSDERKDESASLEKRMSIDEPAGFDIPVSGGTARDKQPFEKRMSITDEPEP